MGNQPFAEECPDALLGVVKDLVRDDDVAGGVILAQGAAGIDADDAFRTQRFQGIDIGPVGHIGGHDMVAEAMPGQESHALPFQCTDHDGRGGFAERCGDIVFLGIGQA